MSPEAAVEVSREALFITSLISAPVLVAGVVVGLVIGLVQALTQIQEQTVAFVPKLFATGLALALALPWILGQLVDYCQTLWLNIPGSL